MNTRQKWLTVVALLVFAWTIWSAPWEVVLSEDLSYSRKSPIWSPPHPNVSDFSPGTVTGRPVLKVSILLLEWAAIAVVYSAAAIMIRDKPSPGVQP